MPKYVNTAKNEFYDLTDPNAPKLLGNMSDYSKTLAEQNFQSYLDSIASQKIANEREWGGNKDTLTNSDWWKTFVSQERVGRLQQEQGNAYQSLLGQTEFREGLAPTAPAPESPYKAPTGFGRPPVQTASMPTGYNGVNTNPDFKAATTGKSAEVAIQMKDKQGNMINVYPSSIPDLIREGTLPNGTNGITLKEATLTSPTGVRKPVVVGGKEASSLFGQNWTLEKTPPTGGTITPESFTGVNKIDTSGAMGASGTSGADTVAAGMQASLDNYLALIKQKDTTDKKAYDDVLSKYISSLTTDVSKESLQATAETTAGISAKEQAVADAYSEVGIKLAEIEALDKSYQNSNLKAEGETVILSVMQGKMNQNFREYSIRKNLLTSEASLLQAKALGLQGKFDAAQKAADRSVDLKYADQLFKSNQQIKLLEVLKGQVDDETEDYRWAAEQTVTDQRNAINQKADYEKMDYAQKLQDISDYGLTGVSVNSTMAQIQAAKVKSPKWIEENKPKGTGTGTASSYFTRPKADGTIGYYFGNEKQPATAQEISQDSYNQGLGKDGGTVYGDDYIARQVAQYIASDGTVDWEGINTLQNVDKALWQKVSTAANNYLNEVEKPAETTEQPTENKPIFGVPKEEAAQNWKNIGKAFVNLPGNVSGFWNDMWK